MLDRVSYTRTIGWAAAGTALCFTLAAPSAAVTQQFVLTMANNEVTAAQHKDHYAYISKERSDRTGGHLWTEKVVETNAGKIRFLLAEDGQPLSPDRVGQERGRLAAIVADPDGFARKSQATKDDEAH